MGPIAIVFCGHLGKTQLDAVALANSVSIHFYTIAVKNQEPNLGTEASVSILESNTKSSVTGS